MIAYEGARFDDDADLALIEANHPSPLVQRLIWKIRRLEDDLDQRDCEIEDMRCRLIDANQDPDERRDR